jgi:hypothetical protein
VTDELESLDVDDIFDKSGARRDGYVDPGDAAFQMFEEALAPFLQDGRGRAEGILRTGCRRLGRYLSRKAAAFEIGQFCKGTLPRLRRVVRAALALPNAVI